MPNAVTPNPIYNFDLKEQEKIYSKFLEYYESSNLDNVIDLFEKGMCVSARRPCLGTRSDSRAPYTWQTYQEVYDQAHQVGSFLITQLGLEHGDYVGIFSKNRAEWVILELGCFMFSLIPVPLYDTLGNDACNYIIDQTNMHVLLAETYGKAEQLIKLKGSSCIKHIILIEVAKVKKLDESGKTFWHWYDILKLGGQNLEPKDLPTANDIAILCYTSGTTGYPKGSKMTHKNIVAEVLGFMEFLRIYSDRVDCQFTCNDVYISYLPLAHSMERAVQAGIFYTGSSIGFFRGDIKTLTDDIKELRPTVFVTVPRLLNRIYDKTLTSISSSCFKSMMFSAALSNKSKAVDKGVIRKDTIWDKLVFSKIQESTGGRIRIMLTGSAPIAESTLRFTRAAFGCPVLEGYGQTECTAGCTITIPGIHVAGPVGVPLPCNMVRLDDVPDMNYFAEHKQGEILIKGINVFSGYYKLQQETSSALDANGWLHTGDIGEWSPEGFLKIIDRKKHLFKLAQGEYIAPEKIEQIYVTSQFVGQAFVDGSSLESFIVAIIVPDEEYVLPWAKKNGEPQSMKELCRSRLLNRTILEDITKIGATAGLKSFEQAKLIYLHPELFSVENGLLTPTFKAKRQNLRELFKAETKAMYDKSKTAESSSAGP